jgi:pimeloyl-ACP methyl ester carboxylesterase
VGLERIRGFAGNQAPVSNWSEAIAQAKATHGATAPGLSDSQWLDFAKNIYREDAKGFPQLDMDPKIGDVMRQAPPTAADPWTLWPAMRGIPALVLRGETSDILSTSTVKRMRLEKPDLITVTVPDRGHAPLLDEPVALRGIDQFLEELP